MARVYERPRYINQARNKLLALAAATHDVHIKLSVAKMLQCAQPTVDAMWEDYDLLATTALEDDMCQYESIDLDRQVADFILDNEIGVLASDRVLSSEAAAHAIVKDFISVAQGKVPSRVLTDEQAVYFLIAQAMQDDTIRSEPTVSRAARKASYDLLQYQLLGQKIAPGNFTSTYARTTMANGVSYRVVNDEAWLKFSENLQYRSQPMWVKYCRLWASPPRRLKAHVQEMLEKVEKSSAGERHRFDAFGALGVDGCAYNYAGIIVVYYMGVMLVMDNSAADYLRVALTALRNARLAFSMIRVAGCQERWDYQAEFQQCVAWISSSICNPIKAREVARHMHLAYTKWQNEAGESGADIDCGWAERAGPLHEDMLRYHPNTSTWWDTVMRIQCPERLRSEFLKLYHLLPPPDIDPLLLHDTLQERTSSANKCDLAMAEEFIKFCKAYDFCRFVSKHHRLPSYHAHVSYEFMEAKWLKSCMAGRLLLPPGSEWGKVQIYKEFDYPHSGDFHVLDAKDSTRVVANLSKYTSRANSRSLERVDQNELLSALFNGPILSNGASMSEWRDKVMLGREVSSDECIAAEAGKAENTKPGKKVRETLSACDTMREYLTEVDHSMRPLAELTPGVSIRVNLVKHKKKFQAMARALSKRSTQYSFGTSTDITGWSPMMDRDFFHRWQEYALSTTQCDNPKAQVQLWDKLQIFVDRRGVKGSFECKTGNIQGWPATSDTTMHAHILIFWAYKLRMLKILSKKEAAYTLCLIDDASTVVALEGTEEECRMKAEQARVLLRDIYMRCGFIMDEVKSFFSSIKFTYLNELYIDGAQVGHGTKTLMRVDKDHTRRFASIQDHISTAFGTAASASSQGADPYVAYWLAGYVSYQWLFTREPGFMEIGPVELFIMSMAPSSLNGLGIRAVTSVFASGENDHLTWFIEICGQLLSYAGSERDRWVFSAFLDQEKKMPDPLSTFKAPFTVRANSNASSAAAVADRFRSAAKSKGLAEPFASLEKIDEDPSYEATVDKVLRAGVYDAPLLEEVAAQMPSALIDQLLARVEKTEIISYLLGGKGIGDLRRKTQFADAFNLKTAYDLCTYPVKPASDWVDKYEKYGSFACAYGIRDDMYSQAQYSIVNHTYPCPIALWSFDGEIDLDTDRARRLTTTSFKTANLYKTVGSETRNMYDSVTDTLGYRGYMTSRSDAAREVKVALTDPVRRMVASGLAAFRWAASAGVHYVNLLRLFLISWAGTADERLMLLPGSQLTGSVKRISLRHNKASHLVYPFQNVQACLRVDARAITTAQAEFSHMYDVMGAITTLRVSGLLEMSLRMRQGVSQFAYGFTYNDRSVAKIVVPNVKERILQHGEFDVGPGFCNIDSVFRQSARVCMTYDSMSHVLATAIEAGQKAASSLFKSMLSNDEFQPDFALEHRQGIATLTEIPVEARPESVKWASKPPSTRSNSTGAVQDVNVKRTRTVVETMPTASLADHVSTIGRHWLSSLVLDISNREPVFATWLMMKTRRGTVSDHVDDPEWQAKGHTLRMTDAMLRDIIDEVSNAVPRHALLVHLNSVYALLGATGFRARAQEASTDVLHQSKSFFGTIGARVGMASAVGKGVASLKHNSADGYSRISLAPGKNTARTLAKVIRAQWRTAAARRQLRADDAAARSMVTPQTVLQNYEASFLRLAAELLSNTATMDESILCSGLVTRAISSMSKHLGEGIKGEVFDDMLDASGMDFEVSSTTPVLAEMYINAAANMAQSIDGSIDTNSIVVAFRNVIGWVQQDVAGKHVVSPAVSRPVHMFPSTTLTTVKELAPAVSTPQDSQLVATKAPIVGGSEDEGIEDVEFHMLYQFYHKALPAAHWEVTGHENARDAYAALCKDSGLRSEYRRVVAESLVEYVEQDWSVFDVIREDQDDDNFVQD